MQRQNFSPAHDSAHYAGDHDSSAFPADRTASSASAGGGRISRQPPSSSAAAAASASAAAAGNDDDCEMRTQPHVSTATMPGAAAAAAAATAEQEQEQDLTSPADEELKRLFEPSIVCGLANIGNTCFANSALQTLANIPAVVCALRFVCGFGSPSNPLNQQKQQYKILPPLFRGGSEEKIVRATAATLHHMESDEGNSAGQYLVAPKEVIRAVGDAREDFADFGSQCDAAQWLLHGVLDACADYSVDRSVSARDLSDAFAQLEGVAPGTETKTGARFSSGLAWTSHSRHAVWRAMARIDEDNAKGEYGQAKAARSKAIATGADITASVAAAAAMPFNTWKDTKYFSPYLQQSALGDGIAGTTVTEVKCNSCGHISRTFTHFTSLELSFPSAAERSAYRSTVQAKKAEAEKQQQQQKQPQLVRHRQDSKQEQQQKSGGGGGGGGDTVSTSSSNKEGGTTTCGPDQQSSMVWKIIFLPCALVAMCCRAIARLCSAVFGSEPEDPLTLEELLWQYCRQHSLRGTNEYNCSGCNKRCPAVLQLRFLELPQTLVVRLKRFEQSPYGGLFTTKVHDLVDFPGAFDPASAPQQQQQQQQQTNVNLSEQRVNASLEAHRKIVATVGSPLSPVSPGKGTVLDLSPFVAPPQDLLPPEARDSTFNNSRSNGGDLLAGIVTTYSLSAVINHHGGSIAGGHYTACARKPGDEPGAKAAWAVFDDHRVQRVETASVMRSQAFVLSYHKQAMVAEAGEMAAARKLAREYMAGWRSVSVSAATATEAVPRMWLLRVACFTEPGPLLHRAVDAEEQKLRSRDCPPHLILIAKQDFDALIRLFGELRLPRKKTK